MQVTDEMIDAAYEIFAGKMLVREEDREFIKSVIEAGLYAQPSHPDPVRKMIAEFFDSNDTAASYARVDGDGGLYGSIVRMVDDIERLRAAQPAQADNYASIAEEYARSRHLADARPTERILGRYEGEQAASGEIARRIRAAAQDKNGGRDDG